MKTEDSRADGRRPIVTFAALAILTGPALSALSNPLYVGLPWPTPFSSALTDTLAGAVLFAICVLRGMALPKRRERFALVALVIPQWAMGFVATLHLSHDAPWAAIAIVGFAAPLWLALLFALQLIRQEIPRAAAGAAIAGIGAFCLMTPVFAYQPTLHELPMAVVRLMLTIAMAYTWAFAAPRLANATALSCAAWLLLAQGVGGLVTALIYSGGTVSPFEWRTQAVALLVRGVLAGVCAWLWFRLLQRMQLSAFAMLPLAAWTATVLPGVWMGMFQWRFAVAPALALVAVVVGVRARVADEQPMALGLSTP